MDKFIVVSFKPFDCKLPEDCSQPKQGGRRKRKKYII